MYSEHWPYIPLLPTSPPDDTLASLSRTGFFQALHRGFVIEKVGRDYILNPSTIASWTSIERAIRSAMAILQSPQHRSLPRLVWPLDTQTDMAPSSFGFARKFPSESAARACAERALDVFPPLMALLCLAILRQCKLQWDFFYNPYGTSQYIPDWAEELLNRGLPEQFIDDIRHSWIAAENLPGLNTVKIPRFGCCFNAAFPPHLNILQALQRAGVPIWVKWTKDSLNDKKSPVLEAFRPPEDVVKSRVLEFLQQEQALATNRTLLPSPLPVSPVRDAIEWSAPIVDWAEPALDVQPKTKNGHVVGEDIHSFFVRAEEYRKQAISKESPAERQIREQCLRAATGDKCYPVPGRRGPRVYLWEQNKAGVWERLLVARSDVDEVWLSHGPRQRRFNDVRNVWDICAEWAPNERADDSESDDEDGGHTKSIVLTPGSPLSSFPEDFGTLYASVSVRGEQSEHYGSDMSFILRLREKYGFTDPGLIQLPTTRMSIDIAKRVCQEHKLSVEEDKRYLCAYFVDALSSKAFDPTRLPSEMWDLHPSGSSSFYQPGEEALTVTRIRFEGHLLPFFIVDFPDDLAHPSYQVAVNTTAIAMECLRLQPEFSGRMRDLIWWLLSGGTPFLTLIPSTGPVPLDDETFIGLGSRAADYKPIQGVDYPAYEAQRDEFLRGPRGRVALMKGGIVWRLARHAIENDNVIEGPVPLEMGLHKSSYHSPSTNTWYHDDDLTAQELDLICGVYRVRTQIPNQFSFMSWWPRHDTWTDGHMNLNYWTSGTESWFLLRLQEIDNGTASPHSASQWKQSIKSQKATGVLRTNYEKIADSLLA